MMAATSGEWRIFLLTRYGDDAAEHAMLRRNWMAAKGDTDGEAICKRVQTATEELNRREFRGQH